MADAGDELITHLLRAAEGAASGLALFDPEDRLRWANAWFRATFGVDPALGPTREDMLRACHRLRRGTPIETEDVDAWLAGVRQRYRHSPVRRFESDLCDGRWISVTETLQPEGWPLLSSRAMRWPLAVAMLDMAHFKHLNDTHGHAAGDSVLRHFAAQLQRQLRPVDIVGGIGGEEFLLMLPNTTLDGAAQTLQRVRAMIGKSVSAARPGDTIDSLVRRADDALYRAERDGRGRDAGGETPDPRSMRL